MSISTASTVSATLTRYRFVASGGETSLSGTDANGSVLSYSVGTEQVYLNGVMQVRGQDYTATNGTSITGLTLLANDVVEILTFSNFLVANAIPTSVFTAKGDILVGTGSGTYSVQSVGTNGSVLVADSTQGDGIAWSAGPAATFNNFFLIGA